MAWSNFQESFLHTEGHRVLGYRLRPFSLYHQLVLDAIESPVIQGNVPISLIDLEIACRVCSTSFGGYRRAGKRAGFFRKLGFAWRIATTSLGAELRKFDSYFGDYVALPERHGGGAPPSQDGKLYQDFPSPLSIASLLIEHGLDGGDRAKVWETPLGEAHWWSTAFLRLAGGENDLITEHDKEFIEGLRKQREAEEAEKSEKGEETEKPEDGED